MDIQDESRSNLNRGYNPLLKSIAAFLVIMQVVLPSISAAQSVGDRLRVTTPDARFDGYVTVIDSTGISLNLRKGGNLLIPHSDVVLTERHLRTRSFRKEGFLIGSGTGAVLGIVAGLVVDGGCENGQNLDGSCDTPEGKNGMLAATIWGSVLGISGYIAGALVKKDLWHPVSQSSPEHLSLYPYLDIGLSRQSSYDIGVGLSVAF